MKKIIKEVDKKLIELDKAMNEDKDAFLFISGGETTGKVNASMSGSLDTMVSVIDHALEYDEGFRYVFMTAMFSYIKKNPLVKDEDLMSMPIFGDNGSIN